ncbi:MAG: protein-tyrosine-phosphatase [Bacteroidota bacterium]
MEIYPGLSTYIASLIHSFDQIPAARKVALEQLAAYINTQPQPAKLNFICTHNSRRSHISQIWAATAAHYYNIAATCYSGGTEATAFNPRAVAAMERAGFMIHNPGGINPQYLVSFAKNAPALTCFSKTYDDPVNPSTGFAAVMTCNHADAHCPFIPGATRIALTYKDPKEADDTPEETARYDERVRQIGTELFYAMHSAAR